MQCTSSRNFVDASYEVFDGFGGEKPEENTALGKPGNRQGMILKLILKNCGGNGLDSFGSG